MSVSERSPASPAPSKDSDEIGYQPDAVASERSGLDVNGIEGPVLVHLDDISKERVNACLLRNRELRKRLEDRLKAICLAQQQNEAQQKFARQIIIKGTSSTKDGSQMKNGLLKRHDRRRFRTPLIQTGDEKEDLKLQTCANYIYFPYFVDHRGQVPMDNRDALLRQQVPALSRSHTTWNAKDRKALANAVEAENAKIYSKYKQKSDTPEGRKEYAQFVAYNTEGLDWNNIVDYVPGRSARECTLFWACYGHPAINKKKWEDNENKVLLESIEDLGDRNWVQIAKFIGRRTPIQCFRQYLRFRQGFTTRTYWSTEEDKILTEGVRQYGERNWQQIALYLKNRNGTSCLHRWKYAIRPNLKRKRWDKDEDEVIFGYNLANGQLLRKAVEMKGEGNWTEIYPLVPGRNDVQCRERWVNTLDPRLDDSLWSPHMDATLCSLVNTHGLGKWSLLATFLDGRTDNQIWRRFKTLARWGVISSKVITHPSFLKFRSDASRVPLPVPPPLGPSSQPPAKRKRCLPERVPEYDSVARKQVGGSNTSYSASSHEPKGQLTLRLHSDLDRSCAIPPCHTSVQLFSSLLKDADIDDSFSMDSCNLLDSDIAANPEELQVLEKTLYTLFAWPHQCANIEMNTDLLQERPQPQSTEDVALE